MHSTSLPLIDLQSDGQLAEQLGASFRQFGFAMVTGHGIDAALVARSWTLARHLFELPEAEKRSYHRKGTAGARGYTPFGTEIAKDGDIHDLKEFWHIGRDLATGHPLSDKMPANVWPDRPAGFSETFTQLFAQFDRVGARLMRLIATNLGLESNWFDPALADGNSVLRLIHYPPVAADPGQALRAGAHEDINLITLLLGAEEAGLELLDRDGRWLAVQPPEGALVVNIGDMLQRLSNGVLPSTTHRVRNPVGASARRSRYSMPFFVHLRSDFMLRTLPQCIDASRPDRSPDIISADEYLQERLREIGLRD